MQDTALVFYVITEGLASCKRYSKVQGVFERQMMGESHMFKIVISGT
jgi:hypothetical protein